MGEAEARLGVAREEKLVAELSILNSMLSFGMGEGVMEAEVLTD